MVFEMQAQLTDTDRNTSPSCWDEAKITSFDVCVVLLSAGFVVWNLYSGGMFVMQLCVTSNDMYYNIGHMAR